jgi:hypothetical protein
VELVLDGRQIPSKEEKGQEGWQKRKEKEVIVNSF